jgi:hypothetical protein
MLADLANRSRRKLVFEPIKKISPMVQYQRETADAQCA